MAEYRAVIPAENRLTRKLGPHAQLVVLHLRCLRFSTPTGLGVFELGVLALDCRLSDDEVAAALTEAARKTGFAYTVDSEGDGSFWIPWQLEHDPPLPYLDNYTGHERRICSQPESKEKARAISAWNDWKLETPAKPGSNGGRPGAKPPTTTPTTDTSSVPAKQARAKKPIPEAEALAIMELWNLTCPSLPQVRVQTGVLCDVVMKSWTKEPDIDVWTDRFTKIEASDFYSGRDGKWRNCDLNWAVTTGRAKIDGKRADGGNAMSPAQSTKPQPTQGSLSRAHQQYLDRQAELEQANGNP